MHVLYLFLLIFLEAVEARVGIGISFIKILEQARTINASCIMHHVLNRGTKKARRRNKKPRVSRRTFWDTVLLVHAWQQQQTRTMVEA